MQNLFKHTNLRRRVLVPLQKAIFITAWQKLRRRVSWARASKNAGLRFLTRLARSSKATKRGKKASRGRISMQLHLSACLRADKTCAGANLRRRCMYTADNAQDWMGNLLAGARHAFFYGRCCAREIIFIWRRARGVHFAVVFLLSLRSRRCRRKNSDRESGAGLVSFAEIGSIQVWWASRSLPEASSSPRLHAGIHSANLIILIGLAERDF